MFYEFNMFLKLRQSSSSKNHLNHPHKSERRGTLRNPIFYWQKIRFLCQWVDHTIHVVVDMISERYWFKKAKMIQFVQENTVIYWLKKLSINQVWRSYCILLGLFLIDSNRCITASSALCFSDTLTEVHWNVAWFASRF